MAKKTTKKKSLNQSLHAARATKQDEFYTQLPDIEKELRHYTQHFKGKTVLCNCDDPRVSNFFHYFTFNFRKLGLKKLITTCYQNRDSTLFSDHSDQHGLVLEYTGKPRGKNGGPPDPEDVGLRELGGDGDFRSPECVELLEEADIVVTNPPFSLFREYVEQLIEYGKKFLILGQQNAITYKEIYNLIKEDRLWLGVNNGGTKWFQVRDEYDIQTESRKKIVGGIKYFSMGSVNWYTNLDIEKRHELLTVFKKYDPDDYPKYDNYDGIEVSTYKDIPADFEGVMGVPITFLSRHNPKQYEIVGFRKGTDGRDLSVNGRDKYFRILIRKI